MREQSRLRLITRARCALAARFRIVAANRCARELSRTSAKRAHWALEPCDVPIAPEFSSVFAEDSNLSKTETLVQRDRSIVGQRYCRDETVNVLVRERREKRAVE